MVGDEARPRQRESGARESRTRAGYGYAANISIRTCVLWRRAVGIAMPMLLHEVLQDGEEVWHRYALTSLAALHDTEPDAFLRDLAVLTHQAGESPTPQTTRPPQANHR